MFQHWVFIVRRQQAKLLSHSPVAAESIPTDVLALFHLSIAAEIYYLPPQHRRYLNPDSVNRKRATRGNFIFGIYGNARFMD
jgi:hypothetical protein